jgi:hypothetical protein
MEWILVALLVSGIFGIEGDTQELDGTSGQPPKLSLDGTSGQPPKLSAFDGTSGQPPK